MKQFSMPTSESKPIAAREPRPWETPMLTPLGTIGELLRGGGGKLSLSGLDTGDPRKPPGQG